MPRNLESNLQIACVRWFRYQHPDCMIASIPNGGYRNAVTASIMKAEGVLAGIPDIIILEPRAGYHGLFIEMKAGKGKLTDNQREIIPMLEARGYKVEVCYSFDEFKTSVDEYLDSKVERPMPVEATRFS